MPVITQRPEYGFPQSDSDRVLPAPTFGDDSPHIANEVSAKVHGQQADSPHSSLVPALSSATTDTLPNFEPVSELVVEPVDEVPELTGLYDAWQPMPAAHDSGAPAATTADVELGTNKNKATAFMVLCAGLIVAAVVVSAVRMSGFTGVDVSADELSSLYFRELVLWVPLVAVCAIGLAAAGVTRTRQSAP